MNPMSRRPGITRWILFIFPGYPLHVLTMLLYPLAWVWWRLTQFEPAPKLVAKHERVPFEPWHAAIRDGGFHANGDDHNALTHWGLYLADPEAAKIGLMKLIGIQGEFLRRWRGQVGEAFYVSGDCVVAWVFAAAMYLRTNSQSTGGTIVKQELFRAAGHYLRNLGSKSTTRGEDEDEPIAQGWVSARCNNFGVNYCPDGAGGIGQPCAGPQFYTTSCLFALASQHSKFYRGVFWVHWVLMGGWLWAFAPVLYTKKTKLGYVRDITMRSLFVHLLVFGPRWWITRPMHFIAFDIAEAENDLFYAMMGWASANMMVERKQLPATVAGVQPVGYGLPDVMEPFFSQEIDATSRASDKANIWIKPGILKVREEARFVRTTWGG